MEDRNVTPTDVVSGTQPTSGGSSSPQPLQTVTSPRPVRRVGVTQGFVRLAIAIAIALLVIAGGLYIFLTRNQHQANNTGSVQPASNYDVQDISLEDLTSAGALGLNTSQALSVNGQLRTNGSLILTPGARPQNAVKGQIYYDTATNTPYVYDGNNFVSLSVSQAVKSIGGQMGDIALGPGLLLQSGQLALDSNLLNTIARVNTVPTTNQVTSVQGQTGAVAFSSGAGITINGTTIANSGVLTLTAASPQLAVTQGANGAYSIGTVGNLATASGTAGQVAVFDSANNLVNSLLSQVGTVMTASGDLRVTNQFQANTITNLSPGQDLTISAGNDQLVFTSGGITFQLPSSGGATQTICTVGMNCTTGGGATYIQLQPGAAQDDTGSGPSIYVNNTGAGDLLRLQGNATDSFVVANNGDTSIAGSLAVTGPINGAAISGGALTATSVNGLNVSSTAIGSTGALSLSAATNQNISLNTTGTGIVTLGTAQLQGSGALQISAGGTNQNLTLTGSGLGNVVVQTPVFHNENGATYRFDSADLAAVNAVVCTSVGNCSSGLGGSGTAGVIAVWNGSGFTLGDSLLSQDTASGLVTVAGDLAADNLQGNGAGLTNVNAALLNGQTGAYYLNASNLNTGTLDDQRLSANIARLDTNANFTGTLQQGGNDVCTTAGNCVGTGGAVGGSGTPGTIAVWNGTGFTLGDSLLSQSGTTTTASGNLTVSGDVTATNLQGNGSAITNVNAAQLNGQSASYYLNATNITSGTLADARLSSNVTLQGNIFNGAGQLVQLNASSQLPAVSGALLTGLNAGNIATGTLSDARLSANVALLSAAANFTGSSLQFNGNNVCTTAGNCAGVGGGVTTAGGTPGAIAVFDGAGFSIADSLLSQSGGVVTINGSLVATSLEGDGAAITNVNAAQLNGQGAAYYLNASNINAGTLGDARLSTNVTLQGNTFNGANQLVRLDATGALPALDGSNLTNVNAALLGGQNGAYYLNLTNATGTLSDARLSSNVALFDAATANFTGTLQQGGNDVCTTAGNCVGSGSSVGGSGTAGTIAVWNGSGFTLTDSLLSQSGALVTVSGDLAADNLQGNGAGVTNVNAVQLNGQTAAYYLNASNVSAGTLADARLSANVTLQGNVFNGAGQLVQLNASSQLPAVSGALLTDLDADQISAGTLSDARLSSNVALYNAATANFTGVLQQGGNNVCTTAGNCAGTGGGVTTTGGTAGQLALFSGAQTLVNSIISDNGSTVTIGGTLAVNAITPTAAMTVGSTSQALTLQGNGSTQLRATAGGFTNSLSFATPSGSNKSIVIPNASGTVAVSASGPISIDANGNISCLTCTTSGGGSGGAVDSLNGLNGALTIANASGSGSTITIDDATTTTKGIASFNSANLTVTAGAVNTIQNISVTSTPSFAGLTLTGNLALAANSIVTSGATISSTELDVLDGGINETEVTGAITDVTAGNGLTGGAASGNATLNIASANAGIAVNADNIALMLQPSGDGLSATTSSGSGLEILSGGLSLLQGCGDGQILKWNETSDVWMCAADIDTNTDTGDEVSVNGAGTTGANFINTIVSGSSAGVTWNLNTTPNPDDISITISNASATDAGVVTTGVQSFAGVKTFGSQIVANGGINLGAQTLQGTTAVIDFNNFDVAANGNTTVGGTLTVTGTSALNGDVTVAAGKSLTITGGATGTRPAGPTEGMIYYDTTTKKLLTYSNGKWQADRTDATIVAASNSSQADKDAADYLADGDTAAANDGDQVQINQALTTASGKKVVLLAGTYTLDASISIPNSTTLAGIGAGTLITIPNALNTNFNAITNTDTSTGTNVTVQNLRLDGNKANQSGSVAMSGIGFVGMGGGSGASARPGAIIENVRSDKWYYSLGGSSCRVGAGICLESSSNSTITNTVTEANGQIGIYFSSSSYLTVTGNTSQGSGLYGISLSSVNYSTFTGNITQGTSSGISLGSSSDNSFSGNTTQGNAYGIQAGGFRNTYTGNTITGNTTYGMRLFPAGSNNNITGNSFYDNGGATSNGAILLVDSGSNTVANNAISDTSATTTNYAIQIGSGSNGNYLSGNTLGGGSINDAGTGTVYGGQVNNAGNYVIQPAGTIELMKTTNVTGDLNVSTNGDFNGSLTVGNANQFVISNTGVVTAGTWQGTAIADAYVADNLTINNAGTVDWQALSNYPAACAAGSAITQLGDTVTCTAFAAASGSGNYIQNQNSSAQATANYWISGNGRVGGTLTADTSVYTPLLDTASATTLSIGNINATTINIGSNAAAHTINIGTGTAAQAVTVGSTNGSSSTVINSGGGGLSLNTAGAAGTLQFGTATGTALDISATNNILFTLGANQSFTVREGTDPRFFVDGSTDKVVTAYDTLLDIQGTASFAKGLRINGSTSVESYTSPLGSAIATAINIPNYNLPAFGSLLAMGLPSGSAASARGILVADARTVSHQATIGVLSPDENQIAGFSWEGSNSTLYMKNSADNVAIRTGSGATDVANFNTSAISLLQNTNVTGALNVSGNFDTNGSLTVGNANQFVISNTGVVTSGTWQGTAVADTYVVDNLTINNAGTVDWQALSNYPAACAAGSAITQLGDSVTCTAFAAGSGSGNYIQNQNASAQATANYWISGNGRVGGNLTADTAMYTPLLDTASAVALNIGTTNATAINLNKNVTVAANQSLTITGGATGTRPASPTEGMIYFDTTTKQLLTYANGKWQADRSDAVFVAASNSSQSDKDAADYLADGNTAAAGDGDQVQINQALTAASGKKVVLLAGTYTIDAAISVLNNTVVSGVGQSTLITVPNSFNTNINALSLGNNVTVRDMQLDGNKANQTGGTMYGVYFNASTSTKVINVTANNWRVAGFQFASANYNTVTNSTAQSNGSMGMSLSASSNNTITDNTLQNNVSYGIYMTGFDPSISAKNIVSGNNIGGNVTGVYIFSDSVAANNTVTGNAVHDNTTSGIALNTTYANLISGNNLSDNGGAGLNQAITLVSSPSNTITSNSITDSAPASSAAILLNTSTGNYIADNSLGGGSISDNMSTSNIYGGQLNSAGNYVIQPAGDVDLLADVNVTGILNVHDIDTPDVAGVISIGATNAHQVNIGLDDGSTWTQVNIGAGAGGLNLISSTGGVLAKTGVGFQVQNSGGSMLLNADTGAMQVTVGGNLTISAGKSLTVIGGNTASRPASPTEGMIYFDTTTKQLLTYSNGKWQADRKEAVIVAASNSSQTDKDAADFVATGTNDGTTVNAALATLPAGGGNVYLMKGTYTLGATSINMPNNTTLSGAGAATVLTYPNNMANANYKAITNSDVATGTHVNIRDLMIDGNRDNQTTGNFYGIYFDHMGTGTGSTAVDGGKVSNVVVINIYGWGIYLTASSNNTITGSTVRATNVNGITLGASSNNNTITGNTLQYNNTAGINVSSSSNNTITGNTAQGNNYGFFFQTASTNTVTGNTMQAGSNYGMRLDASTNNTITGNTVRDNGFRGIYLNTASNGNTIATNNFYDNGGATNNNSIYLDASDSNTITGNTINDSSATTTNFAINISNSTADTNYLSDNTLGTGSVNDAGTGTIYGGQVNSSGNYQIQPAGTIELMKSTNVTGDLAVNNGLTTLNGAAGATTWTSRTSPADNQWQSIAYGNGTFVAVAATGTGNRVMTSPDGITWTARTSAADNGWYSVTYGNGLFVAVSVSGTGNRVMTSPDGITWTSRTSAADNQWLSVTYGNGLFVAVANTGTGNRVMTSPDGITWTSRTSAADNQWRSVTYGNGLFVAVANTGTGNRVMTSPDGITWTSRTSADNSWRSVTYGNGLFVAVSTTGAGNDVMTSPDGITWTLRTTPANNWYAVTYGNGTFVAVKDTSTGNRVMTSTDGINWTVRTSAADNDWYAVTYGNGTFVAVAATCSGNCVMTSSSRQALKVNGFSDLQGSLSVSGDTLIKTTSGTAFQIQNSASAALLTADTSSMRIVIGSGSNTITLSPTNGFRLAGTARNSKTIRLLAEYPSVVLAADLTNNLGTMTSGYDSTARMNYYNWTTTQGTNQDYDIVVQVPLPTDFDSWDGSNPLSISTYTTNTTNGTIALEARDSSGAVICNYVNVTPGSTTTWATNNSACTLSTGTYTPGDYITLRIKLQAPNGGNTRVGNIVLNYKSKF